LFDFAEQLELPEPNLMSGLAQSDYGVLLLLGYKKRNGNCETLGYFLPLVGIKINDVT